LIEGIDLGRIAIIDGIEVPYWRLKAGDEHSRGVWQISGVDDLRHFSSLSFNDTFE
jgi:hypothetical protein